MKYLKLYERSVYDESEEEDNNWRKPFDNNKGIVFKNTPETLSKFEFKIGDYILVNSVDIYRISAIDTMDMDVSYRAYYIKDETQGGWCRGNEVELFANSEEEYEMKMYAKKYNL